MIGFSAFITMYKISPKLLKKFLNFETNSLVISCSIYSNIVTGIHILFSFLSFNSIFSDNNLS